MADFKVGDHVLADFGDNVDLVDGYIVAHVAEDEHDGKYGIQAPNGQVHQLGYRETKPGDETGRTFKKV